MKKSTLVDRLFLPALTWFPRRLTGISVLMYHSISDMNTPLAVSPKQFERQMRYIHERGFKTVFASEIPALLATGDISNTVCVTLDDGYRDNYTNAFPILSRYNIKASIFIITGLIGKVGRASESPESPFVSEQEIVEMTQSGLVECLPHSHSHKKLTGLSPQQIAQELE